MSDRAWELYRFDVVTRWPDSDYKSATLAGIADRLKRLEERERNVVRNDQSARTAGACANDG